MVKNNKFNMSKTLMMSINVILFIGLIFHSYDISAETRLPNGCTPTGFSFKYYVLTLHPNSSGKSQSLYFVHNKTLKTIKIYQMRRGDEPHTMHLNNKIRPNQWGVYATDEKEVRFICTIAASNSRAKSKYGRIIDCDKVIELCEYKNVKFSYNNQGNYWGVNSASKWGAIRSIIFQGILLRW